MVLVRVHRFTRSTAAALRSPSTDEAAPPISRHTTASASSMGARKQPPASTHGPNLGWAGARSDRAAASSGAFNCAAVGGGGSGTPGKGEGEGEGEGESGEGLAAVRMRAASSELNGRVAAGGPNH